MKTQLNKKQAAPSKRLEAEAGKGVNHNQQQSDYTPSRKKSQRNKVRESRGTSGFTLPNFTQTPNELFEFMPEMSGAELRVVLALLRQTSGFHRARATLSISKISAMTGLSGNAVTKGMKEAQLRGIAKRLNKPGSKKSAEWEIRWSKTSSKNEEDKNQHPQKMRKTSSKNEEQLGFKENINKEPLKEREMGGIFKNWKATPEQYHPLFEVCIRKPIAFQEPTGKEINAWLETFDKWLEAGFTVEQVIAAARAIRKKGTDMPYPWSITWKLKDMHSRSHGQETNISKQIKYVNGVAQEVT